MKKASVLLLSTAAVLVAVLLSVNFAVNRNRVRTQAESSSSNILSNSTPIAPSSQESSEINAIAGQESKPDVYTVKEYESGIGVFHNDDTTPIQKIDVDVASLPEADQELLKEGIKVYSVDRLNQIIEDYES